MLSRISMAYYEGLKEGIYGAAKVAVRGFPGFPQFNKESIKEFINKALVTYKGALKEFLVKMLLE